MVENGDFFRVLSVSYFDGPRWPHLTRVEGSSDSLTEVLRARGN